MFENPFKNDYEGRTNSGKKFVRVASELEMIMGKENMIYYAQ